MAMTLEDYRAEIEKQIEAAKSHAMIYRNCKDGSYNAALHAAGYYEAKEILDRLDDGDEIDYIIHISGE